VGPHARKARQRVLELRQFDLHLRLARPRAHREDVENQLGAVHHAAADRVLDVLALAGTQLVVEDDERRAGLADLVAQLLDLSGTEVRAGVRPVDLLDQVADDDCAGRIGELLELTKVLADGAASARPLERRADEQRPLDRRGDD